jgi:hypothetical protein
MLIGGIQGDEPGGFLSVDHYADINLARGRLIVVPRANFRSIILNRRKVNADMNRQFSNNKSKIYEVEVVNILKQLIAESDCLLNLHDGSGFYSPTWESDSRNPNRYGQSIIADDSVYRHEATGRTIDLESMAQKVCDEINRQIDNPRHHFRFNNHRTSNPSSAHKEQRASATYYALTVYGIPAFGIETSKSLPLEDKVYQHNLAVNAFMRLFGVEPETPGLRLERPQMRYIVVAVNNDLPVVLENGHTLHISPGDTLTVSHIEANYDRGLSADIVGVGGVNDVRRQVTVETSTDIIVRKDNYPFGRIRLAAGAGRQPQANTAIPAAAGGGAVLGYDVRRNGDEQWIPNGGTLQLVRGDTFEIVDVTAPSMDTAKLVVNLKGFVGNRKINTGEDRGYKINSGRDLWKRYSLKKQGRRYRVITTRGEDIVGRMYIELGEPRFDSLVFQRGDGGHEFVYRNGNVDISDMLPIQLVEVRTNLPNNEGVTVSVSGPGSPDRQVRTGDPLLPESISVPATASGIATYRLSVRRGGEQLGEVQLTWTRTYGKRQGR